MKTADRSAALAGTRDGFGEALANLGAEDARIVVLTADLSESTRAHLFQAAFPDRFIECGVAEQNMMGVAAGLALAGKIPFACSYAAFSPGRSWDQLRVSVCYARANVKVIGAHAGVSVGPDGATHQALEDVAITRVLPNITVIVPCDFEEAKKATRAITQSIGPAYLRLSREPTPVLTSEKTPFRVGRAELFRTGRHVTILACGPLVASALDAARMLERDGIEAEVINSHTIKPFDEKTLLASVKKTGACVTVEEHQVTGGLFGAAAETLSRFYPVPMEPVGMPDTFGQSGEPAELLAYYGMDVKHIMLAAKRVLSRKRKNGNV